MDQLKPPNKLFFEGNYGGLQVQNKTQFWKQNNKLQTQMQI